MTRLTCALLLAGIALLPVAAQTPSAATGTMLFEGARLIAGDGRPAVENSAFVVEGARITQVGTRGSVRKPDGATVVDLTGKTVIPALIDAHSHLGYTDARTGDTSSAHYARDNLLDHLRRYAYYGSAATLSTPIFARPCTMPARTPTSPGSPSSTAACRPASVIVAGRA